MLIAVLAALIPHLIWFTCGYLHLSNPSITIRVRAAGKLLSLLLSIALFCLIVQKVENLPIAESDSHLEQESEEVERMVKIFTSPENYLRYLEVKGGNSPPVERLYR